MELFGIKTGSQNEVVSLLQEDHEKVKELFKQFEAAKDRRSKQQIVQQALQALTVHAQIEEEFFYPAIRESDEETEDLMDEALQEHHVAKILIGELEGMKPTDEFYDAKFTVLAESVKHHIEEEESEVFPYVSADGTNWEELGQRMAERRQQLLDNRQSNGRAARKPARRQRPASSNSQGRKRRTSRSPASSRRG